MNLMLRGGAIVIGCCLLTGVAHGQAAASAAKPAQPQVEGAVSGAQEMSPYILRTSTRLVVLDLVVTDTSGHVVGNIGREHFHVTEEKLPQKITSFEEAGTQMPLASLSVHSTAELDKVAPNAPVNIFLLDEFNTRFEDMAFARYALKKYFEKQPDKLDVPTMLIAVNLQRFTVLRDYTQDRQELLSALDHHLAEYPWQVHSGGWTAERFGAAFMTLRRVAMATEGHAGHKNMIWIGRGFPSIDMATADPQQAAAIIQRVQECVNLLQDARITLYTVDPSGVQVTNTYDDDSADPLGGNYQFSALAAATGGHSLYGRNDVDAEISTAIVDGTSFYTLSYRPNDKSDDASRFRKIRVTVDIPGLKVLTHQGYFVAAPAPKVDAAHLTPEMMRDLLLAENSRMVYDGVPITVGARLGVPNSFTIHIPARGVTWSSPPEIGPEYTEVLVTVKTFDKGNNPLHRTGQMLHVERPGSGTSADVVPGSPLDLPISIQNDARAVRARFVVCMEPRGSIGTADVELNTASSPSSASATSRH